MAEEKPVHGTICWNELMTRDTNKAANFYKELVGWEATDSGMPGIEYTLFKIGYKEAGGMMMMPAEVPAEVPAHWLAYVAVDNVDAMAKKIPKLGGNMLMEPMDIPGIGRFCVAQDPTGAALAYITFSDK